MRGKLLQSKLSKSSLELCPSSLLWQFLCCCWRRVRLRLPSCCSSLGTLPAKAVAVLVRDSTGEHSADVDEEEEEEPLLLLLLLLLARP